MALVCATHPFLHALHRAPSSLRVNHGSAALRLVEDDKSYTLHVEIPGVSAEGVALSLTDAGELKVRVADAEGHTLFSRELLLEADADPTTVTSWCKDGLLEVKVAKFAPPEPILVEVQPEEPPALAVDEDANHMYELHRSVPGMSAEEVAVRAESSVLHISAKSTRGFGERCWRFDLPEDALAAGIRAFCLNGLLTVRLPRRAPTPPMQIGVASSSEELPKGLRSVVRLQVPGHVPADVRLEAAGGMLYLKLDRDGRVWERRLRLPDEVADLRRLRAVCADGLLEIGYEPSEQQPEAMEIEVTSDKPPTLNAEPAQTATNAEDPEASDWIHATVSDEQ